MVNAKYLRLKQIAIISTAMAIAVLFIIMPIQIFIEGVSVSNWEIVYKKVIAICSPIYLSVIIMAWLFIELYETKITRAIAALIFGVLSPAIFFLLLGLAMFIFLEITLHGVTTPEGAKNILWLYLMFSTVSVLIYWGGSKNA